MGSSQPIQSILEAAVEAGVAPGLSAAVYTAQEGPRFFQAGVLALGEPALVDNRTAFGIASCTKAVVSAAALVLVDRKLLDLDQPVGQVLPHFVNPQVLEGFDAAGEPKLRPARKPVTLRRLLSHSAGLAYDLFSADIARYLVSRNLDFLTAGLDGSALIFEPGDGWQYGPGIDVAGQMMVAVTGDTLANLVEETILRPLGMGDTTFAPSSEQLSRRARLHMRDPDGRLRKLDALPPALIPAVALKAGAGFFSTPSDFLKFLRAVIDGGIVDGKQAMPATVVQALMTPQIHGGVAGNLKTLDTTLSQDFCPLPGISKAHTLGFVQNLESAPGMRGARSLAWAGLSNCYYWADAGSGVAGVLCAQMLPFADPRMLATVERFERVIYSGLSR